MDFSLTEEQQALADLAGKILADRSTLALLKALEQSGECIDRETWATLAKTLTEAQLIELPIVVGQYLGVAFLQNSVRIRLLPTNPGLTAR